ncbi:hypothetical protein CSUI_007683 [Cystoisospora suis]|uniref:Uncharacterized protein n=1 Tax=Cystoisospora suis TaxID=483139 RepID=A0A2C6KCW9_9APIC|nr:hypothetical protein CSUI_007683 [Cystoisospora suis]
MSRGGKPGSPAEGTAGANLPFYTEKAFLERNSRKGRAQQSSEKDWDEALQRTKGAKAHTLHASRAARFPAFEADMKRRYQPGFFVPSHYMLPVQQYLDLYRQKASEADCASGGGCDEMSGASRSSRKSNIAAPDGSRGALRYGFHQPLHKPSRGCGTAARGCLVRPEKCGVWEYGECEECAHYGLRPPDHQVLTYDHSPSPCESCFGQSQPAYWPIKGARELELRDTTVPAWAAKESAAVPLQRDAPSIRVTEVPQAATTTARQESPAANRDGCQMSAQLQTAPSGPVASVVPAEAAEKSSVLYGGLESARNDQLFIGTSRAPSLPCFGFADAAGMECSSPTPQRYASIVRARRYLTESQDPVCSRLFSLLLGCRRLEKNIQSQYLQMDLYEEGYGRKLIEDVIRPAVSNPQEEGCSIAEKVSPTAARSVSSGGEQARVSSKRAAGFTGGSPTPTSMKEPLVKSQLAAPEGRSPKVGGASRLLTAVGTKRREDEVQLRGVARVVDAAEEGKVTLSSDDVRPAPPAPHPLRTS